ncbi:MAG TPA: ABC transporter ATP-binding protein [Chloroflexota bacterium]|nr:ABC transporter ATP-binding protein [Chloroflexota bacterium]
MIKVEHLTKYYGPRAAVRDLTFDVAKGEILGFLGPNGAGKTTTMRILTGYMPASSGTATVAGYDVFRQSIEARRHIGYLPESVPLYTEMEVADYLRFMARIRGVPGRNQRPRVDYVMEALNLTHVRDRIIGKLSKGYRQRVGIAQALVADPDVLILDEPTIGLDPVQIIETRNLIRSLAGNHTVILSTHILPEVSATCQRVLIINDGEIAAEDTPDNLTRRLRGAETLQLEVRGPREAVAGQLRSLPNVMDVTVSGGANGTNTYTVACALGHDLREQLAATIVGQGWGLLELRPVRLSLEEIFLEIITEEHDMDNVLVEA